MDEATPEPVPDEPRSRPLLVAAGLVGVEAAALAVLGVVELFAIDSGRMALGVTNSAFFLLYAAGLGFAAWGFSRARTWSRGPVVLAQFIQLGVAWSFYGNDTIWLAALLAVVAIVVLGITFAPSTTQTLYGSHLRQPPQP